MIKTRVQQEPATRTPAGGAGAEGGGGKAVRQRGSQVKIWHTAREVVRTDGVRGLWRGTGPTLYRFVFLAFSLPFLKQADPMRERSNVPGVSMYFLTLSRLRSFVGTSEFFRAAVPAGAAAGGKVKLTTAGDLIVGSTARTGVGFLLMPFTLMKTISEVRPFSLPSSPFSASLTSFSPSPPCPSPLLPLPPPPHPPPLASQEPPLPQPSPPSAPSTPPAVSARSGEARSPPPFATLRVRGSSSSSTSGGGGFWA